jgi:hypothetical protein
MGDTLVGGYATYEAMLADKEGITRRSATAAIPREAFPRGKAGERMYLVAFWQALQQTTTTEAYSGSRITSAT